MGVCPRRWPGSVLEKLGAKSFHKLRWVELQDDELAASEKGVATLASINTSYKRFVNYLQILRSKISSHLWRETEWSFWEKFYCPTMTGFRAYLNAITMFARKSYIIFFSNSIFQNIRRKSCKFNKVCSLHHPSHFLLYFWILT